jgi:hypothetical protein
VICYIEGDGNALVRKGREAPLVLSAFCFCAQSAKRAEIRDARAARSTQLAEEGADEAAERHLIPNRAVAKGVQLRLLRQRVVMTAQKAQADVLLHRLHYALPGWDAGKSCTGSSVADCSFG